MCTFDAVSRLFSDYMFFNRSGKPGVKTADTFHDDCSTALNLLQNCLASEFHHETSPHFIDPAIGGGAIPSFANRRRCVDNGEAR